MMLHAFPRSCAGGWLLSLLWVTSVALGGEESPAEPGADREITSEQRTFFEERIRPVLVQHCYECHASDSTPIASDYALDTRAGLRGGGAWGEAAVVPGAPDKSLLLQAIDPSEELIQMPPDGPLESQVVADFRRWIAMGAPDPRGGDPEAKRRAAEAKAASEAWALRPPRRAELPEVEQAEWPRSAIDYFLLARMEEQGLRPVRQADPRKLIRRVHFDLIGLPPTPAEVERFAENPSQQALAEVVDRLLQSPRFGERWGRHWLDLARYAESSGMEFNFTYPHAWPYRDYVIDAFNQDKPYDRFVTEQLAGDLLPADSPQQRDENRIATGFLAIGPKRHNAGRRTFTMDMVDDQIKATSGAFLGLTAGCARCHDHKFDPIPTKDYYALAGIFLSTEMRYGTTKIKYSRHPSELIPFGPDAQAKHQRHQAHQKKIAEAEKKLADANKALEEAKKQAKKAAEAKKDGGAESDKAQQKGKKESKGSGEPDAAGQQADPDDPAEKVAAAKAEVERLKQKVKQLKEDTPEPPRYAMGASEGEPTDAHVAIGGDPGKQGEVVRRGFLSAVAVPGAPPVAEDASGRLELARWITDRDNPLTARVMVNRVWQHLFGRGIVETVNNFGALGQPPTHPKLLDHLAVEFMEDGWSVKRLIRRMVLSSSYQLSTRSDPHNAQLDPNNRYLWRMTPRRLEVEPLRDAILAVSGQLDLSRPDGSSVTPLGQQLARGVPYEKINPPSRRRTVYLPVVRHYLPKMLQEFDFAAASLVVGDRAETTTSQQALFFLNDDFVLEQARATAALLMRRHPGDTAAQVRLAYRRALARGPSASELAAVEAYLQQAEEALQSEIDASRQRREWALASFVQTLFGSAEFRYLLHRPQADSPPRGELAARRRS